MTTPTTRRPTVRLDPERRPHPSDLDAHRPELWPTVRPGQSITVQIGFGLDIDTDVTAVLARYLRPARALRIAGRSYEVCKTARILLVAIWREQDGGAA